MEIKAITRPWERKKSQGKRYNPDPFYQSQEWKRLRAAKLAADPYCECDECKGKKVKAEMVDHRERIKSGGSRTEWNNLQSMTNRCHAKKSAKESNQSRTK